MCKTLEQIISQGDSPGSRNFFGILDIHGVNADILHQSYKNNTKLKKTDFINILADELVRPHLERSAANPRILLKLQSSI